MTIEQDNHRNFSDMGWRSLSQCIWHIFGGEEEEKGRSVTVLLESGFMGMR